MTKSELEGRIVDFARRVYAAGGLACDKSGKRVAWRAASKQTGLTDKAADKAVERATRHPLFSLTLEELSRSGVVQQAVRHAAVTHDGAMRRVVRDRADWLGRLYFMAESAEKEEVRLKALDMIGRAEGHYAPVQAQVGIQADLAVVLAALSPEPLVRGCRVVSDD